MNEKAKSNINLLLSVLQSAMKETRVAVGWDMGNNKLVLQDIDTKLISRIDLTELNRTVFRE